MASLGRDLAHIRKERNISLEDVYEATKIPKRIIRSIEDDSIFTDFRENPTYIRSYVRSYSKALSIDEKQIVYALDKREKDNYTGSLQELMESPPKTPAPSDEKAEKPEQKEKMVHDHTPDLSSEEETETTGDQPETPESEEKPTVRSVDWANMGRQFQPLKAAKSRTSIGIFAVFLLLAAGAGIFYFYFYNSNPPGISNNSQNVDQQETSQTISSDSLELNIVPTTDSDTSALTEKTEGDGLQNESLETMPDTLSILLYAAYGKLEPVRVYTDIMDDINPYWIEDGEALRFNFVNDIHIRGQTSRMVLFFNGHVITDFREQFYNPETRLVEINRSHFEGDPKWLQPAPETPDIDAPPPIVKERPIYN